MVRVTRIWGQGDGRTYNEEQAKSRPLAGWYNQQRGCVMGLVVGNYDYLLRRSMSMMRVVQS